MENKNYIWRPVSEYTGGRVLATNGSDVIIGEINSDGDCKNEEDGCTILCGITGFIKIEEMLPELKKSECEDQKIRKDIISHFAKGIEGSSFDEVREKYKIWIAWLEKQGKLMEALQISNARIGELIEKNYNMGISEATKKRLEDNLNKALEKETPESWNKFLEKQGEQKPDTDFSDLRTWKYIVDAVLTEREGIGQYLDSPFTEEVAKKLQERFGNIEQKPADKVEPKFKVGDWIISHYNNVAYIESISETKYNLRCKDGYHEKLDIDCINRNWRLWTIQDAKEGDVLCDYIEEYDNPLIFILNKFERVNFGLANLSDYSSYCFLTASDRQRFKEGQYHHIHNIKPATKEQRDFLFQKMKEVGYTFDFEKKELKKIEMKPAAWSEEDEEIYKKCILAMRASACGFPEEEKFVEQVDNWFKSLKDRVQPKQEWSKEDDGVLLESISVLQNNSHWVLADKLKSLKERYTWSRVVSR